RLLYALRCPHVSYYSFYCPGYHRDQPLALHSFPTRPSSESLTINKALYNQMIEFCKEEGCSSFHYFLGILFLYFSKICNRNEMVIGVPVFNRSKAKYKQTLGHFANLLPLRFSPGKDISFKERIKSINRGFMQFYRIKKLSFGE
ncbi:hypothetical protein E4V51_33595, partial [Paenibacillus sp. 28ISP30-2]|nr:hypothetical protein [Paenibacillus sp. 28ISP30-2]